MNRLSVSFSRRDFIRNTGRVSAAAAMVAAAPKVHAAEQNTIQVALVGCGGRGTGAAANALSAPNGPMKLVAMADVFPSRLTASYQGLAKQFGDKVAVPEDRRCLGFDAYRQAMDALRPGDVVILTTPPAFRWPQFAYAIEKGLNVFMEKPVSVDGPSTRRMLRLGAESVKKNLKVGVGLMSRHCEARLELVGRLRQGDLGEIVAMRTYRMHGPIGFIPSGPKPADMTDLMYQVQRFHSFLWASGGCYSDFYIHNIDECCWMKDAWPVKAQALGGRHYRGDAVDQNLDTYSVEHTFADGTKLFLFGRNIRGCFDQFSSYLHGAKGLATVTACGQWPGKCKMYRSYNEDAAAVAWANSPIKTNPYQLEWNHLIDAIRNDKPWNEVQRGAEASLVTAMGRMAAHTGQTITYEQMLNHDHEMAPEVDRFKADSPSPLMPGGDGKYPVPQPGVVKNREY